MGGGYKIQRMEHLVFFRFILSLPLPVLVLVSSILRDRMSLIRSKNTCSNQSHVIKVHCWTKRTHLVNVFAGLGRCFNVRDAPLLRAVLGLLQRHLPSLAQIAFIAHQQERNIFVVLHSENLFPGRQRNPVSIRPRRISLRRRSPEFLRRLETVVVGDGEDAEESLSAAEVVVADGSIIFLSGGVQNVNLNLLAVQYHFLPVWIGFGRLVIFNKLKKWENKREFFNYFFF